MGQSIELRKPLVVAFGSACLLGWGLSGCSRSSLDVAKEDAGASSSVTERANESIERSRLALSGKSGPVESSALAETEPEIDTRPSLASRWKNPLKGAGGFLRKKEEEDSLDPFLASAGEKQAVEAAESQRALAAMADEQAAAVKSKQSLGVKQVAMAETPSAMIEAQAKQAEEARTALNDFLKSQQPADLEDRSAVAATGGPTEAELTRKPGTTPRSQPTAREMFASRSTPSKTAADTADPTDPTLEHRVLGKSSASLAAANPGKARPFPSDFEPNAADRSITRTESRFRQPQAVAVSRSRNPLAETEVEAPVNPLAEGALASAPAAADRGAGRQIANLLNQAQAAANAGDFDLGMDYAVAAKDLAEQCGYEFATTETSPEDMVNWLSDQAAEAEQLATAARSRRQLAAARKGQQVLEARPAGFAQPSAEDVFGQHVEEQLASRQAPVRVTRKPSDQPFEDASSPFQEWAAGVGTHPIGRERTPEWPVLSASELAQSDDLWQPSLSSTEPSRAPQQVAPQAPIAREGMRLASAESEAPAFVATADVHDDRTARPLTASAGPLVELGEPTDVPPGGEDRRMAWTDTSRAGGRRGPRIATPPPLSIHDSAGPAVERPASKASRTTRMVWFTCIGLLSLVVLVVFRRWAYRAPTPVKAE